MAQPISLQQQTLAQVIALTELVHSLDKKIDSLGGRLDVAAELSHKHERVLYRKNGDPGLLDRFDDLEDCVTLHREQAEEEAKLVKFAAGEEFGRAPKITLWTDRLDYSYWHRHRYAYLPHTALMSVLLDILLGGLAISAILLTYFGIHHF